MNMQFDEFDKGILSERQNARFRLSGPQVGDFIKNKAGQLTRITHLWDDGPQTNGFSESGEGGSFYLGSNGKLDYSGGLEPSIPLERLKEVSGRCGLQGSAWFFHHNQSGGGRGVYFKVWCKVFHLIDDNEIIDKNIPGRYIIEKNSNGRNCQSTTYTTKDGIERVSYTDGQKLEDYLKENPELLVISGEEFDILRQVYINSLITKPAPCSKQHFYDMLECLPPCRWGSVAGSEVFHVSERLTANLVQWCVKKKNKYYSFTNDAALKEAELIEIINAI